MSTLQAMGKGVIGSIRTVGADRSVLKESEGMKI
jgi:hypothetical protein